jgi:hypothetical protein
MPPIRCSPRLAQGHGDSALREYEVALAPSGRAKLARLTAPAGDAERWVAFVLGKQVLLAARIVRPSTARVSG